MADLLLWLVMGLPLAGAVLLFPPLVPGEIELAPSELGFLGGNTKGAVLTALVALHDEGLVKTRARGGVSRTAKRPLHWGDPFQQTVYNALHTAAGPRELATRPAVRRARDAMAKELADAGLLPGRARLRCGRIMLGAVPLIVALCLGTGEAQAGTIAGLAAAVLVAAVLWPLSRRTIAGHRVWWTARQEHTQFVGSWRPGQALTWSTGNVDPVGGADPNHSYPGA